MDPAMAPDTATGNNACRSHRSSGWVCPVVLFESTCGARRRAVTDRAEVHAFTSLDISQAHVGVVRQYVVELDAQRTAGDGVLPLSLGMGSSDEMALCRRDECTSRTSSLARSQAASGEGAVLGAQRSLQAGRTGRLISSLGASSDRLGHQSTRLRTSRSRRRSALSCAPARAGACMRRRQLG